MNKKLLRKQFVWQRNNANYLTTLSVLIAWGLGARQIGISAQATLLVFSILTTALGIFLIMSKSSENKYGLELFDQRRNIWEERKNQIISSIFHYLFGIFLAIYGVILFISLV